MALKDIADDFVQGEPYYVAHSLPRNLKEVHLIPVSDVHYGNPLCSVKHFRQTVKYLKENRNAYAILNGDLIECITRSSVGGIFEQKGTAQEQRDFIVKELLPIKDKILGATTGNHEQRIQRETGFDISKDIANSLECPYRPEGLLLKISAGSGNNYTKGRQYAYFIYFTHGYGGARTQSAKAVKAERASQFVHADVVIMSHDHVTNVAGTTYLIPDARTHVDDKTGWRIGKVNAFNKKVVKSNAYLKWGGYAEMGGFPPTSLNTPIIKLLCNTGKPEVKVEI